MRDIVLFLAVSLFSDFLVGIMLEMFLRMRNRVLIRFLLYSFMLQKYVAVMYVLVMLLLCRSFLVRQREHQH